MCATVKRDQARGQQEHMRGVPTHQGQRAEIGAAFQQAADVLAGERDAARDVERDGRRPVRL